MKRLSWLRTHNLSQQLLWSCGVLLVTVGLVTLLINYQLIQANLEKQVQTRAQSITQSIEFATEGLLEVEHRHILERVIQNYGTLPAVEEILILNPDDITLSNSQGNSQKLSSIIKQTKFKSAIHEARITGISKSYEVVLQNKSMLVQILPFNNVLFGNSGRRGLAIAFLNLEQMKQEASQTFLMTTLILIMGIVIILFFMGMLIRKNILYPLQALNQAVINSKETAIFIMPKKMPTNEIKFLARTFQNVFEKLESQEQLKQEITQRQKIEAILRESEARERSKAEELEYLLIELKKAQAQLVQNEKMSSLGQLVAGVAHEINNPVNFIYGNIQYLQEYIDTLLKVIKQYQQGWEDEAEFINLCSELDLDFIQEDLPKLFGSMKSGTHRIREIVLSLRNFSRLDESNFKAVDIHEGIESTLMILQHRLKKQSTRPAIQVIKHYGKLSLLECHAGKMNQVFLNLLTNAIDTLEEKMKNQELLPTITIHTSLIDGEFVKISITDNGLGMTENIQNEMFNPFFTTKPVGQGIGMGMSISYQIVNIIHKGKLDCYSVDGQGTEFVITIPIHQS